MLMCNLFNVKWRHYTGDIFCLKITMSEGVSNCVVVIYVLCVHKFLCVSSAEKAVVVVGIGINSFICVGGLISVKIGLCCY